MRVTEQPNRRRQSTLLAVPLLAVALWLGACGYKPLSETRPDAESGTVAGTAVPPASGPTVSTGIAVGEEARKNRYATLARPENALSPDEIGYFADVHEGRLRQALAGTSIRIQRVGDRLLLTIPGRLSFDTDSTHIIDAARPALAGIATVLVEFDKTLVSVFGHTDNRGDPGYNQALSEKRAISVARFLAEEGVATERLAGIGYGQRRPALEEDSARARTANRRIEILIEPISADW